MGSRSRPMRCRDAFSPRMGKVFLFLDVFRHREEPSPQIARTANLKNHLRRTPPKSPPRLFYQSCSNKLAMKRKVFLYRHSSLL